MENNCRARQSLCETTYETRRYYCFVLCFQVPPSKSVSTVIVDHNTDTHNKQLLSSLILGRKITTAFSSNRKSRRSSDCTGAESRTSDVRTSYKLDSYFEIASPSEDTTSVARAEDIPPLFHMADSATADSVSAVRNFAPPPPSYESL